MSANFDDDVSGPFDGSFDERHDAPRKGSGKGSRRAAERYTDDYADEYGGEYADHGDVPGQHPAPVKNEASGLEVVGGALFLAGCLPAAAVAKAIKDGTNLAAPDLGGTAALAAKVAHWLGPWAALVTSAAIAVIGALMVLGNVRTEPLRRVAGVLVAGLGLAAVMGALVPESAHGLLGGGGQIGLGTGGDLAVKMGTWAGVLLGLAVMSGAIWLGFVHSTPEIDEDDGLGPIIERDDYPRASAGSALAKAAGAAATVGAAAAAAGASLFKRQPRSESEILGNRANRQRRVSNKKVRRTGAPVTLGDALARGGREGVSHDEAAALAPDDKTLAYMEDVWRRASHSMEQPEPIPKSPYPEDVRLKGLIPDGAAPLHPRPGQATAPPRAQPSPYQQQGSQGYYPQTPTGTQSGGHAAGSQGANFHGGPVGVPSHDVAPFDFDDELSAPKPLNQVPPPKTSRAQPSFGGASPYPGPPHAGHSYESSPGPRETDPFGGAPGSQGGLSPEEAAAYKAAVLREGASATGPSELPHGVKPFVPRSPEDEAAEAEAAASLIEAAGMASYTEVEFTEVPAPSGKGTTVSGRHGDPFSSADAFLAEDPMSKQAMQAGAMPASVSPPPRPAWETGYDDDDDESGAQLSADLLESIPDVDEKGRWLRRDEGSGMGDLHDEYAAPAPTMSALDELLAQVAASESALSKVEADLEGDVEAEIEVPVVAEVDLEEAHFELEDEIEDEIEEEVEASEESDDADEEESEEEAELEDGEEEEEYEYVDEDGNPIDPADLGDEYELVDEDEEEEDDEEEAAEYEEDDDDEEAAEYEEDDEEEEDGEEEGEYEEYEEEAPDDDAEAEAEAEDDGSIDVILEPQAPPTPSTTPEAAPAGTSTAPAAAEIPDSGPDSGEAAGADPSQDGSRLLEAGRLIVSKDRAAVSVIQKGFDVEFAEACSILEALFAEGLIGPYQEGKKRAILMSLKEWEGRFAHS